MFPPGASGNIIMLGNGGNCYRVPSINIDAGKLNAHASGCSGTGLYFTTGALAPNIWHHFAFTFQSGSQAVFHNGYFLGGGTKSAVPNVFTGAKLTMGSFGGYIRSLAIYRSILQLADVLAIGTYITYHTT